MGVELLLLPRVAYRDREVTGPRVRALLAVLADGPRTGSSADRLVDGLWPQRRPANPTKALQVVVSRARAQLGAELIVRTPAGYRLGPAAEQVDASALAAAEAVAAGHARRGEHAAALAAAEAGLALWDGRSAADGTGTDDPVAALRCTRAATRSALVRVRALALARLGRPGEAVDELAALHREHPRDEEVLAQLLRAEAATAGPAAALARYEAHRRALRDELGTAPGPALREVHLDLLREQAPAVRRGVPHEPNPLLGREADLAAVAGLLRTSRVTSVVGPGGLGKTRLARAVARGAEQRVVHLVALAGLPAEGDAPGDVLGAVATAVGAGERPGGPTGGGRTDLLRAVVEALGSGPALLVLDNCEHVVRGAADLVAALVALTAQLRVLTTGRTPLGLSSEAVHLLPALDPAATVELFGQRARAARPDAELPAEVVARLCARLDGLPLAVELAAARVRVLSVGEIDRRLDDRFALLRGGPRDAPARHRTLRAVVDWSWALLDERGRTAMRLLSAFPDGFTAAAAEHVLGEPGAPADALPVLEHLLDQSLLGATDTATDTATGLRFRMLETVREYAAAAPAAPGDPDPTERFLRWVRAVAAAHHGGPLGVDPEPSLALFDAEAGNLWHAVRLGLARDDVAAVASATAALCGLWLVRSRFGRLGALVDAVTGALVRWRPEPALHDVTRTALTCCLAFVLMLRGVRASRLLVALRRLPPAPPDTLPRAVATVLVRGFGSTAAVHELCSDDRPLLAGAAHAVACYLWDGEGDTDRALRAAEGMLEAYRRVPVPWLGAGAHARISELALQAEQGERARHHIAEARVLYERLGAPVEIVGSGWWLVLAGLQLGELDEAERWLEAAAPEPDGVDDGVDADVDEADPVTATYGAGVRAEIQLARGEVAAGLAGWRRISARLLRVAAGAAGGLALGLDQWLAEALAVTVVAHAQHGHLDLVGPVVTEAVARLSRILAAPTANPPPHLAEPAMAGALLLAVARADLAAPGAGGDARAARMIALAERCRYLRAFQPTMSSQRARAAARAADAPAYDEAVAAYADLARDELWEAGRALLAERRTGVEA